jgi:hypothetical protein
VFSSADLQRTVPQLDHTLIASSLKLRRALRPLELRVHDLRRQIGKLEADLEKIADQLFAQMGENSGTQSSEAPC